MKAVKAALALALASLSFPALAEDATLTVKDGRALVIGGELELGNGLAPTDWDVTQIADEFQRLCVPPMNELGDRIAESALELRSDDAIFSADGKTPEARIARWSSRVAELSVWAGDHNGLMRRPIAMPAGVRQLRVRMGLSRRPESNVILSSRLTIFHFFPT